MQFHQPKTEFVDIKDPEVLMQARKELAKIWQQEQLPTVLEMIESLTENQAKYALWVLLIEISGRSGVLESILSVFPDGQGKDSSTYRYKEGYLIVCQLIMFGDSRPPIPEIEKRVKEELARE